MRPGLAWLCVVGGLLAAEASGQPPGPGGAAPALDKATLAEVRKLQGKRRDVLRDALEGREMLYQKGRAELGGALDASRRLLAAELDLAANDAERVAAHRRHLKTAQALAELAVAKKAAARGTEADVLDARALALEAEIGLLKAGGKPKEAEKPGPA